MHGSTVARTRLTSSGESRSRPCSWKRPGHVGQNRAVLGRILDVLAAESSVAAPCLVEVAATVVSGYSAPRPPEPPPSPAEPLQWHPRPASRWHRPPSVDRSHRLVKLRATASPVSSFKPTLHTAQP